MDKLRISIVVNEVFDGWEPTDDRLGGTELQVVKWAEGLAERGHEVSVYKNGRTFMSETILPSGKYVNYYDRSLFFKHPPKDICINVKSSDIPPKEPTIYFTNETNAPDLDLSAYDYVVWPSFYAAKKYPVNNENIVVIPHGYDPEKLYPGEKISKLCLYASSPDRGLDTLLRVWPNVVKSHPDAQLVVTYGAEPQDVPNTLFLGNVSTEAMYELYREADIWCHPCNGGELFCITGLNAQAAGCIPVIIPKMALYETVRQGYFASDEEEYEYLLIDALHDSDNRARLRKLMAQEDYPTWDDSTDQLEVLIEKLYNESK